MINIDPVFTEDGHKSILFNLDGGISKPYKIVEGYTDQIEDRIKLYNENIYELEKITLPALPKAVFDKLEALYDLTNETIKLLKDSVKEHHIEQCKTNHGQTCVYCGIRRNKAEDLDHYLPRSVYPEFSILSHNLIYVCKTCNQTYKKTLFVDSDNIRYILNPYFDELGETNLLECNIDFSMQNILPANFKINPQIEEENEILYKIACNHFDVLNLRVRYFQTIYSEWTTFIDAHTELIDDREEFTGDIETCNRYIDTQLKMQRYRPLHNFEKLFWEALQDNQDFLVSLLGTTTPKTMDDWISSQKSILNFEENGLKYTNEDWTRSTYEKLCNGEVVDLIRAPIGANCFISIIVIISEYSTENLHKAFLGLEDSINTYATSIRTFAALKKKLDNYKEKYRDLI